MADLDAVVFDIGNVFVQWDPRRLYRRHFEDEKALETFLRTVTTPAWNLEQDRGRSFAQAVDELSQQFPHYEDLIRLFDSHWIETLGDEIAGTVKVLDHLVKSGVPVFAITNFSAEKWPVFCERHQFTQHFHGVIVSGEERIVKPDPRIYELAIERFGLQPDRSIFIDDSKENVTGAQHLGLKGHHFTDAPALAADLKKYGLLV